MMNILITLAEVILLLLALFLLNGFVGVMFNQMINMPLFQGKAERLTTQRKNISRFFTFSSVALCLLLIGLNGLMIYEGKNIQEVQLNLIRSIPSQFWPIIFAAIAKTVILLILMKFSLPPMYRFLDWCCEKAQTYDNITANDESIADFFSYLKTNLTNSIWILAIILCAQFLYLPAEVQKYLYIPLKAYLILTAGFLVIKAISAIRDTLDALRITSSSANHPLRLYERLRHLVPLLQKTLEYFIYVSIVTVIVKEIYFISWLAAYTSKINAIIGIIFTSAVVIQVSYFILEELILETEKLTDLQRQRRLTIIPLIKSFLKYLVYFGAGVSILKLINIDPAPILAGAGIVGIAVGFGAQALINDIVCGFFILFENYYLVGDYIEGGKAEDRPVEGIVEAIELRTTRIRHPHGQLQIVRNGEIGSIVNYSKEYIYAMVEVSVSYHWNLDRLYRIIEEVGEQLKAEEPDVLEPTKVEGLENLGKDNLLVYTATKVKPGRHIHVQRVLRKMLKHTFDREEIDISMPLDS